jgi:hypothetical protein
MQFICRRIVAAADASTVTVDATVAATVTVVDAVAFISCY